MNVFGSELCVRFAINEWRLCFRFYVNLQSCIGEMSTSCRYSCKPCWMKAVLTRALLPFCRLAVTVTVLIFWFCTFIKFGWGSEQCTLRMLQTKQLQPRFVSGTQIQWNEQNTKKFVTLLDCFVKFSTQILYLSESPLLYSSVDLQLSSADIFQVFCSLLQTKTIDSAPLSPETCIHNPQMAQISFNHQIQLVTGYKTAKSVSENFDRYQNRKPH